MAAMRARLLAPEPRSQAPVRTKGCAKEALGRKTCSRVARCVCGGDWVSVWIRVGRSRTVGWCCELVLAYMFYKS